MNKRKISIVTGGGSGLGLAIARKFAMNDVLTLIIGRDKDKLDRAQQSIGPNCIPVQFDMNNLDQIPALIQRLNEEYGQIDVLVNNAGINLKKPMTEVTDEEFARVVSTNLFSVFSMSREVAKVMIDRKQGSIINISSMAAYYGIPRVTAYTASKAAIEGLTRAMTVELAPMGIRVNCIAPGFIETDMSAAALNSDPERKNRVLTRTPMGKLGSPEDVANMVYFLTTDEAGFITGTSIPIDGGNSIGF